MGFCCKYPDVIKLSLWMHVRFRHSTLPPIQFPKKISQNNVFKHTQKLPNRFRCQKVAFRDNICGHPSPTRYSVYTQVTVNATAGIMNCGLTYSMKLPWRTCLTIIERNGQRSGAVAGASRLPEPALMEHSAQIEFARTPATSQFALLTSWDVNATLVFILYLSNDSSLRFL